MEGEALRRASGDGGFPAFRGITGVGTECYWVEISHRDYAPWENGLGINRRTGSHLIKYPISLELMSGYMGSPEDTNWIFL